MDTYYICYKTFIASGPAVYPVGLDYARGLYSFCPLDISSTQGHFTFWKTTEIKEQSSVVVKRSIYLNVILHSFSVFDLLNAAALKVIRTQQSSC